MHVFVQAAFFRKRLEILARRRYRVLPLDDAVRMLREGSLPSRSVAITFDDGFHDFHEIGFPLLREFGFPATVYQSTYYSDHRFPVFNVVFSYLLWRGRGRRLDGAAYAVPGVFDLASEEERRRAVDVFRAFVRRERYTPAQRNELACRIAGELDVDYAEILRLRMLQLMTPSELAEIAAGGIDVQLHTHRHRMPLDEKLFVREIRDNREWIVAKIGTQPNHFCYPGGQYRPEFLPWLRAEHVVSATTCDRGIADRDCEPLLLPRLPDLMSMTDIEFESWLAGISAFLPHSPR
ncbi:MAG: polysaccharide deacetylase family protein [Bryobacteraceae bacterium]|jgi:peptidoglycan/xylan/chitin deacetylase (PgdA/CDA1 family)